MPERPGLGRGPLVAGASLVAVLLGAIGIVSASSSAGSTTPTDYRTATVGRGPVAQQLTLNGTAQLSNQVTASFPASGMVTAVRVKVGDHVSAGQTLATIDQSALRSNLLAAQASLAQDQASLVADQAAATATAATSGTSASSAGAAASAGAGRSSSSNGSSASAASASSSGAAHGSASSARAVGTGGAGSGGGSQAGGGASGSTPKGSTGAPKLSAVGAQRALTAAQLALRAEDQACLPVLGTPASSGTGGSGRPRSGPSAGIAGGTTARSFTTTSASTTTTKAAAPARTASGADPTTGVPESSPTLTVTGTPAPTSDPVPTTTPPTGVPTGTPTGNPTGTPSPTSSQPGAGGTTPTPAQLRSCAAAMDSVSRAQHAAGLALTELATQVVRELKAIMQAASVSATPSSGAGQGSGTGRSSGTGQASGSTTSSSRTSGSSAAKAAGSPGTNGAGGTSGSATRAASDEVAILQDQALVTQAEADLSGATLKAPIAGTVGQVGLTAGQVAANQQGVVIVGPGAATVVVDVPLADMGLVRAGLSAAVTPAGDVTSVPGTVEAVNLLPASTQTTTPSYPATVVVPKPTRSMASGSIVAVAITVGRAVDAIRLPVSAVAGLRAGTGDVQLLDGDTARTQAVSVGAVGGGYAQVLSGLAVGQRVVLADAAAALPSNQTAGLRGLGGGLGGRFGGAGGAAPSTGVARPGG